MMQDRKYTETFLSIHETGYRGQFGAQCAILALRLMIPWKWQRTQRLKATKT